MRLAKGKAQDHFNPRTREGCDLLLFIAERAAVSISIHAPVKGATLHGCPRSGPFRNFNPRTREGCDLRLKARTYFII